ncbi:hypothetical protein ACJJIG_17470 [Microbulbifer sp. SSSA007]|uniref:hypothetical protein n=1 Tax=Microbulbifer sp. SSSA007 TaxID=3243379 RepID=UPI004039B338
MRNVIIVLALIMTGCVTMPHYSNLTPEMTGEVKENGVPANNLPIHVISGNDSDHCEGKSAETTTNAQGEFYLAPLQQFNFTSVIMAHSFFPWSVCAKKDDTWFLLAKGESYALVDSGPMQKYQITCNKIQPATECKVNEVLLQKASSNK